MRPTALLVLASCAVLGAAPVRPAQETIAVLVSREVYLMGTRAQLSAYAVYARDGFAKLESALAALEETEEELSTWRESSEISALNRQPVGKPWLVTPRLCRTLAEIWKWHRETKGAFDPAIGKLLAAWDIHGEGAIPSTAAQAQAFASSGMALLAFDETACTVTRRGDVAIDVGAFGKGEGLDRAAAALGDTPWMIDLGGQVSVGSRPAPGGWTIGLADPRRRDIPVLHVRMTSGSLATSAGSERDLAVNGARVGHILDPGTGHPAPFDGSVTVWHERGLVADILSTALYVMGPETGLRWAEARSIAACYLIPGRASTRMESTPAFRRLITAQE